MYITYFTHVELDTSWQAPSAHSSMSVSQYTGFDDLIDPLWLKKPGLHSHEKLPGVLYVCMCVCMYVYTYVCMYICMSVCMCVCLSVCMHACMHVCMYVSLLQTAGMVRNGTICYTHNIHTYIHTYIHIYMTYFMQFPTLTNWGKGYIHTYIHTYTQYNDVLYACSQTEGMVHT